MSAVVQSVKNVLSDLMGRAMPPRHVADERVEPFLAAQPLVEPALKHADDYVPHLRLETVPPTRLQKSVFG